MEALSDVWQANRQYLAKLWGVPLSKVSDADVVAYARPRVDWPPQGSLSELFSAKGSFPQEDDMNPDSILAQVRTAAEKPVVNMLMQPLCLL